MYVKQCFAAFACALTIGLATGGYAQTSDAVHASPSKTLSAGNSFTPGMTRAFYTTPEQALNIPLKAIPLKTLNRAKANQSLLFKQKSFVSTPLYQDLPLIQDPADKAALYFRLSPPQALNPPQTGTASFLMDDFNLPAGMAGSTVTDVTFVARNFSNTLSATETQNVYGTITFYGDVVYTLNSDPITHIVNQNPLADPIPFVITSLAPGVRDFFNFTLPTPLVLPRDISSQTDTNQYGFAIRFYDDALHTIPSPYITAQFPLATSDNPGVQLGESNDSFWYDQQNTGNFTGGYNYFGGYPDLGNLILQINGTATHAPTYSVTGTLNFTSLMTSTANGGPTPNVTFTFTSTTMPTATPISLTFPVTLSDVLSSRGTVMNEAATYEIIGLPLDTYSLAISSPGDVTATDTVAFLNMDTRVTPPVPFNHNVYNLVDTLAAAPGFETVSGSVTLEGVPDLSAISPFAPLGALEVQFRPMGSTTPTYDFMNVAIGGTVAGSPNGFFSVTGIADGTYDVWIKGPKNLAVLSPGVVINSTSTSVPVVFLPAGDADGDNFVGPSDFGIFVGAYNTIGGVAGNGYDPRADFNFDGSVDPTDFGYFVGEYNTPGAP